MRWNINRKSYEMRDTRIRRKFLLFPMTINEERRWFEVAEWEEKVFSIYTTGRSQKVRYSWCNTRWLN